MLRALAAATQQAPPGVDLVQSDGVEIVWTVVTLLLLLAIIVGVVVWGVTAPLRAARRDSEPEDADSTADD